MRPGGPLHRLVSDVLLARISLGMVVLALVVGVPLGIELGQAYKASHGPAAVPDDLTPPTTPSNLAPRSGALMVSRTPTFRWSAAEDASAVRYALQWSADPQFRTGVEQSLVFGMNTTSFTVSPEDAFTPGVTIYWHVVAVDSHQHAGRWSNVTSFTTGP